MRNRRLVRRRRTLNQKSSKTNRMLKTASSFVLVSSKSSTYPRGYASGFDSPAALLESRFEHPVRLISENGPHILSAVLPAASPGTRRVSARRGWAGENDDHFEHPTGSILRDEALGAWTILKHRPSRLTPYDYLVSSFTRWPSSGRMSFSIASLTAFSEPGVEKSTRPLMIPAVARLMMAGEPISW